MLTYLKASAIAGALVMVAGAAMADYPNIRMYIVPHQYSNSPQANSI